MAEHVYLLTILLPLATILIVFAMKYGAAALQAQATKAHQQAYQALAEKSAVAQQDNAAALASIKAEITQLSTSLASVEAILKQVG